MIKGLILAFLTTFILVYSLKVSHGYYESIAHNNNIQPINTLAAVIPVPEKEHSDEKIIHSAENKNPVEKKVSPAHHHSIINKTKTLVAYIDNLIRHARINYYRLGGDDFNKSKGIYGLDCSAYVDHVLKDIDPASYHNIAYWSRSYKPTSGDYYDFINKLPNQKIEDHWYKIQNPQELQTGDILVFKYKNPEGKVAQGHVMVVMSKPVPLRHDNTVFMVKISDAAPEGHSYDTRTRHRSGIGIGSLLLKVDAITKKPVAYAWKVNSAWKNDMKFAMARPISKKSA